VNVALVGAGNVAARYARCIEDEPRLTFAGATDVLSGRAAELVAAHGGRDYGSLDAVLADAGVDLVVNLTAPKAHASVTKASLEAGKHVHTEKPLALLADEARQLAELATRKGVRLSCAPATLLGEAQQTAWKLIREGGVGTVRAVYAEANWGRIETWHPEPETLYESGPMVDVGVYPLTILTAMFGPVRRVSAYGTTLLPDRVRKDGRRFSLSTPDFYVAELELASGVFARLTATFWVRAGRQRGLEFHGDDASLWMPTWSDFDSRLERTTDGETYVPVPLLRKPYPGTDWARALADLAEAVAEDRPHRMSAEHAAHVVEALNAIDASARGAGAIEVRSDFVPPEPFDWAR
jgi:predicted dehydrogenase